MPRHCYVLRVFTREGEGGNPLGVVTDRSGLPPAKMQEIATELGFSETIYLDWRSEDVPRVRIFTPTVELPFAGHPLVGMTWVLHELGPGGASQLECGIGLVRIGMDGEIAWVDAPLNQRVHLNADPPDYNPGTDPVSLAIVDMPVPYHVIQLASAAAVAAAPVAPSGMTCVFARTGDGTVRSRFFAAGSGIAEDPATGSAAVALAATLRAQGEEEGSLVIAQGEEMGAPSTINLSWDATGARIAGTVAQDEVRWLDH